MKPHNEKYDVSNDAPPDTNCSLLKEILDHVADPIFVKDKQHRWIYGNQAFTDIMGVKPKNYLNKSDYDFFPKEEADVFWKKDNDVFNSDTIDVNEEHLTDAHGNGHIISTKKTRLFLSEDEAVLVGIIRDVTAAKEVERLKDEFISMVSHELRTPLTSIRASLEILSTCMAGKLPNDMQNLLQIACRNSESLERIINEILDFEKIGSGKECLQIMPIHLGEFLTRVLLENCIYGQKYNVRFKLGSIPDDMFVLADESKLMRVMSNLLSNAAKFSPSGATVDLIVTSKSTDKVCIQIQDYGSGIPEKFRAHIFGRFAQADSSNTRKHEGTGLGLYITKQLVEAMHGAISFDSEENRQTTFYVELPACIRSESNTSIRVAS